MFKYEFLISAPSFIHPFIRFFLSLFLFGMPALADVKVIDQNAVHKQFFADVLGNGSVVINFIYTQCRGVCPGQGKRFEQLQKLLGPRLGTDITLVSLSIDPEHDSPGALKLWSEGFNAGKNWTLVIADRKGTDAICKQILGMTLTSFEHSPFIAIRSKQGQWQTIYGLSSAGQIVAKINESSPTL